MLIMSLTIVKLSVPCSINFYLTDWGYSIHFLSRVLLMWEWSQNQKEFSLLVGELKNKVNSTELLGNITPLIW